MPTLKTLLISIPDAGIWRYAPLGTILLSETVKAKSPSTSGLRTLSEIYHIPDERPENPLPSAEASGWVKRYGVGGIGSAALGVNGQKLFTNSSLRSWSPIVIVNGCL